MFRDNHGWMSVLRIIKDGWTFRRSDHGWIGVLKVIKEGWMFMAITLALFSA